MTHRDRLASTERTALDTLATFTMPAIDDGGRALIGHLGALVALRAPNATDDERADLAQIAAILALAEMAKGMDALDAARLAAHNVTRAHLTDMGQSARDLPFDPTDGETVDALDRIASWSPERPDGWLATTDTSYLNDVLASAAREDGPNVITATVKASRNARGTMPARLLDTLKPHAESTLRRYAFERGTPSGGALAQRTDESVSAHRKARADALAAFKASRNPRTPAPGHRSPVPSGGACSAVVLTDVAGSTYLLWEDHTGTERRTPINAEQVAGILARHASGAYTLTDSDRWADDYAYRSTPVGAALKPSGSKRKRDGGIGSPTIMRGPRHDWSTRSTRA